MVLGYSLLQTIRMKKLNLESVRRHSTHLCADVLQHLESTTSAVTAPVICKTILKGRQDDVSTLLNFSKVSGVSLERIGRESIRSIRHNLPTERQLPGDPAILQSLPVELLTEREIPVVAF